VLAFDDAFASTLAPTEICGTKVGASLLAKGLNGGLESAVAAGFS
jgi:hypothetical protein